MILNTGQRTDIPAFYSEWLANRLRAGFVCTRSPYNPTQVTRFRLGPSVVDAIGFCTKNPEPMLRYMDLLQGYGQFWYVTITPYGHDIEPNVPDKRHLLTVFQRLSDMIGSGCIGWRYDPIFISERYTKEYHLRAFSQIAEALEGYTDTVVISFIDLYHKVLRNFPEAHIVPFPDRIQLGKEMVQIAQKHGMTLRPCAEGTYLSEYGADCSGCMTIPMYERAIGHKLLVPRYSPGRRECACYLSSDIGAYDSCLHLCRYCYANQSREAVLANRKLHDPESPFLIGNYREDDVIRDASQKSWIDPQMSIFDAGIMDISR